MGTGKTAVGKRLARALNMKYVSTDDIIEAREERPINDIFAKNGEPYFRKVEKDVVKEISGMQNVVVAAGGGAVLDDDNMNNLRKSSMLICLKATPEDIVERTKNVSRRPLLNVPSPIDTIRKLLEKRAPFYAKADHIVDTSGKNLDQIVEEIIKIVRNKEGFYNG